MNTDNNVVQFPIPLEKYRIVKDENNRKILTFNGGGDKAKDIKLCGELRVIGKARDANGDYWSTIIEMSDQDRNIKRVLIRESDIYGNHLNVIKDLVDKGLFVFEGTKNASTLASFLKQSHCERLEIIDCTGWHGDSFVLPNKTIGTDKFFLPKCQNSIQPKGTLESWQENVSNYCRNNSRLMLAASTAFASPLLALAGKTIGGVGVHLVGASSQGKTTALRVADSIIGAGLQSWRATDNGLEGIAARHSDIGLLLDDIGQVDANVAGAIVYMLGNGQGKVRSQKDGTDKPIQTWRLYFMSTGEVTFSDHLASVGKKSKAGQEVRILNVEADAGAGIGVFEDLHGSVDGKAFADILDERTTGHYGHAGHCFIEYLVENREGCINAIKEYQIAFEQNTNVTADDDGQVRRVAAHFALIAAAGELATKAGITNWGTGESNAAATTCFDSWRKAWTPRGTHEAQQSIEQTRSFIQQNAARFSSVGSTDNPPLKRAGFASKNEYWIYRDVFTNEICDGVNPATVKKALKESNYLVTECNNKFQARRSAEGKRQRFYVINDSILDSADDE